MHISTFSSATLIVIVLLGSVSAYLYMDNLDIRNRYTNLASKIDEISNQVNTLVDYGNGTRLWYNSTLVPLGSSLLNATAMITDQAVEYGGEDLGVFVTGIGGVGTLNEKTNHYWLWWRFDQSSGEWLIGNQGANQYIPVDGDVLAWLYEDTLKYPKVRKP
ncbi:MAG: hypothetical protein ACXABY_25060 [Candidatus Thorarchaeota archaeon]|jgi:hypothetical protein